MKVQQAKGTFFPGVSRVEYFKLEAPQLPGVVFLQDLDGVGTDVQIQLGGPGSWAVDSTVSLAPGGIHMEVLPTSDPYVRLVPQTGRVVYEVASLSPFIHTRTTP